LKLTEKLVERQRLRIEIDAVWRRITGVQTLAEINRMWQNGTENTHFI
jgi:hypothetical protein